MTTWKIIQDNVWYEEIEEYYGDEFPIEMRVALASFLEKNEAILSLSADDQVNKEAVVGFFNALIVALCWQIIRLNLNDPAQFYMNVVLEKQYRIIQEHDPLNLLKVIQNSLRLEKRRILQLQFGPLITPEYLDQCEYCVTE